VPCTLVSMYSVGCSIEGHDVANAGEMENVPRTGKNR